MFDPDTFTAAQTEGEMSTEFTPVPEGEWKGLIESIKARQSNDGEYTMLDINWAIDDEKVSEATGIETPKVRQTLFLDITESGGLDMGKGKNIQLGRLREAINQNNPGPWSPSMLVGNVATVKVERRIHEGRTYADVKNVVAL